MDWLLLRGLARESSHWGHFPAQLQRARPRDRIHTLDLPGTGANRHLASPADISQASEFLDSAMSGMPRPLGLIGLSLGGMVALDWTQRHPGQCAALVLISSSSGLSRPWQRLKPNNWWTIGRLIAVSNHAAREEGILALTSNTRPCAEVTRAWQEIAALRPVSRRNVLRQLWAASRYRPRSWDPGAPGLVLASKADRLVDWRCSKAIGQAWGWPLALHETAGHDLTLDDPDWVVDQIVGQFPCPKIAENCHRPVAVPSRV
ncbi:alpha/beta fold hydrolase [Marinobacter salicampi]|uniref:alpha/beta fold hydrolase n=1 Tax=Marinobacter salicampi TaxID=435907 RepID=UPI00140E0412|nr:alpha/beta hydrolase [Marinobacter salicampi]